MKYGLHFQPFLLVMYDLLYALDTGFTSEFLK